MGSKVEGRMANSVVHDQTVHSGAVWPDFTLFSQTCLPDIYGHLSQSMTKPGQRLSSDSVSAQSDQSLHCLNEETLGPFASHWVHSEDWSDCGWAGWSEPLLGIHHLLVLSCCSSFITVPLQIRNPIFQLKEAEIRASLKCCAPMKYD